MEELKQEPIIIENLDHGLELLNKADDCELSFEFLKENSIMDQVQGKIDAIKCVFDKKEDEIARYKTYIKEFQAKIKSIESNIDRMEDYFKYVMQKNNFEKLAGQKWSMSISKNTKTEFTDLALHPTPKDFLTFGKLKLIEMSYSFKRDEMKKYIKANPETNEAKELTDKYIKFIPTSSIKFSIRKES